jgi:Stage II sporulation protein E (SpoIIE)
VAGTSGSAGNLAGAAAVPLATTVRDRSADARQDRAPEARPSPIVRTVRDIVETVPGWIKLAIAALGALALLFAGAYAFSALRARSLARQRSELLGDVGLLQRALLPTIPDQLGGLAASVAYRPADGPGAGGDFYDALPLPGGRAGFVLGDVSGHGRAALERTAFMRYTLRAYLEAGLDPSTALQVAGRVIGDGLDGDFATVLLAIHDPGSGSLTYASAGHPAPILAGAAAFEPVIAGSSPPIGVGEPTGMRQTTVPLVPGAVACLYTDGLIEARTAEGLLGRERLQEIVEGLGPDPTATELLEHVAAEAVTVPDDMATCVLTPTARVTAGGFRTEWLELTAKELEGSLLERFLDECGVPETAAAAAADDARRTATRFDGAVVSVAFGGRRIVDVLPRNVASIESAVRRAS